MTDALNNLCDLVAHITGAQAAVIAQQDLKSKTIKVRGRVGTLVSEVDMTFVLPEMSYEKAPLLIVPDIRSDSRFQNHPLLKLMPHLKSLTAMLIPVPPLSGRAVLKIINPRRSAMLDGVVMQILSYACATASAVLRMAERRRRAPFCALPSPSFCAARLSRRAGLARRCWRKLGRTKTSPPSFCSRRW